MSGVNKVILLGRLGQDPELKDVNGTPICNFSMATSDEWKDDAGEKQERTEWHRVVAFRKTAELAGKFLTKGRQVYIEGKSHAEAAGELDLPLGTVKSRVRLALQKLQLKIER